MHSTKSQQAQITAAVSETTQHQVKVARNEIKNASFAQRSAHRESKNRVLKLIEPAAERNQRARGRRRTFKSPNPTQRFATVQQYIQLPTIMSADICLSF